MQSCACNLVEIDVGAAKMIHIRALELYSGIGGFHYALQDAVQFGKVTVAVDINTTANETYKQNFSDTTLLQRNIESITTEELERLDVNLIWMSPPCQPFTRLGKKKDCSDLRTSSFLHIIEVISRIQNKPLYVLLENVKGFEVSEARNAFVAILDRSGYTFQEFLLTPQQFGVSNSRLRYYIIAILKPLQFSFATTGEVMRSLPVTAFVAREDSKETATLETFLETGPDSCLTDYFLADDVLSKYSKILDIANSSSRNSCCFTKGYGHYVEGTGSVLHVNTKVKVDEAYSNADAASNEAEKLEALKSLKLRYFTPREIANILGFPHTFRFPTRSSRRQRYRLLGNSLNVVVVSNILKLCFESRSIG